MVAITDECFISAAISSIVGSSGSALKAKFIVAETIRLGVVV